MHIINFFIAIFLPYMTVFSKIGPTSTVPDYFFFDEASFVAGELGVMICYWAGYLRSAVEGGKMSERTYYLRLAVVFVFVLCSKIIFILPTVWFVCLMALGLGFMSTTSGQVRSKRSVLLLVVISIILFIYSAFILLGMAWFNFTPTDYYYYRLLVRDKIIEHYELIRDFFKTWWQAYNLSKDQA